MQVDALIRELIATGTMNEDTLAELQRLLADYEAGKLDPDDEVYLRALHARLTNAPPPPVETERADERLEGLSLAEWRDRALAAEAELAALRQESTTETPAPE
ncbi:MAG TPA: hypothetical protein VGN80_03130 [Devosiaceae bacterium]|nr:hypothetical protein [Devosiaceae bacterium]